MISRCLQCLGGEDTYDRGEFDHLLLLHTHGAQAGGVGEGGVEVQIRRGALLLRGEGVQQGGVEEAQGHAGDVGGGGAVVAHLAVGLVGGVVAAGGVRGGVGGVGGGAAGGEEVVGEVFLPHADALADQVVLVALQLAFEAGQLAAVRLFLPAHPVVVGGGEVWHAQAGGGVVEARVELDVLALLRRRDGHAQAGAGERRAVGGDVGEAEGEEGAWGVSVESRLTGRKAHLRSCRPRTPGRRWGRGRCLHSSG